MKFNLLSGTALSLALIGGCAPQANNDTSTTAPLPTDSTEGSMEAQVAAAGVAKQGRSLDNESGIGRMIAQPAITLFTVKERVVFEIQIPQAMNLFNAMEGRAPKSHEEFMEKVIKGNNIILPELQDGMVYQYRTDTNELWVEPLAK